MNVFSTSDELVSILNDENGYNRLPWTLQIFNIMPN